MASSSQPLARRRRAGVLDVAGIVFALLYGAPSLLYPLAPDQSLFFYVGQAWWHGKLPYRDVFDQKPPGIFALYALATWIFGSRLWAVHVFELVGVVLFGALIAAVVRSAKMPAWNGLWGLSCVLFSLVYYSSFDYWNFGQVEYWQGLFALASFVVTVWRPGRPLRAAPSWPACWPD